MNPPQKLSSCTHFLVFSNLSSVKHKRRYSAECPSCSLFLIMKVNGDQGCQAIFLGITYILVHSSHKAIGCLHTTRITAHESFVHFGVTAAVPHPLSSYGK